MPSTLGACFTRRWKLSPEKKRFAIVQISARLKTFVLTELDAIFLNRFGRRLSLPLRVQQEGLRARLRQFARIQAPERRAGWRIRHGELRFEEENTLHLAGLPIVGALDRVDVHEETGQRRILDYKTSAKRKSARSMHFDSSLWGSGNGSVA